MNDEKIILMNAYRDSNEKTDRWILAVSAAVIGFYGREYASLRLSEIGEMTFQISMVLFLVGLVVAFIKVLTNTKFYWGNYSLLEMEESSRELKRMALGGSGDIEFNGHKIKGKHLGTFIEMFDESKDNKKGSVLELGGMMNKMGVIRNWLLGLAFSGLMVSNIFLLKVY